MKCPFSNTVFFCWHKSNISRYSIFHDLLHCDDQTNSTVNFNCWFLAIAIWIYFHLRFTANAFVFIDSLFFFGNFGCFAFSLTTTLVNCNFATHA